MQHIETVTVGSGGAASITFSAIPDTFTDLIVVCSLRGNRADSTDYLPYVKFNGSTTGYSSRNLTGFGSSASSNTSLVGLFNAANSTANTFGNMTIYIPNYRSAVAKSYSVDAVGENNATEAGQRITAALWTGTAAITSIELDPNFGSLLLEHSSASLYGITAGSDGIVAVS